MASVAQVRRALEPALSIPRALGIAEEVLLWLRSSFAARCTPLHTRDSRCCGIFGPHALTVVGAAFDQAWQEVQTYFVNPLTREVARLFLASAVLGNATNECRDVDALKWTAIRKLVQIGHLPRATILESDALKAISASQHLIALSRVELESLRASIRSARARVEQSSALLQLVRSEAVRISS